MRKTRKQKRNEETKINFFAKFLKIKKHFFKDINSKLRNVKDKRNQSYVEYKTDILLFTIIMKNIVGIESMNKMTLDFNRDECINNIANALGYDNLEEIPHYDTINNFLKILEPTELENIRTYMIKSLFKKRSLEHYRLLNKYWTIAIDGTGLYSFNEKHCEHCLKREYKNKETGEIEKTVYFHSVLEAKLILGDMVFSIGTEFIENESEEYDKQDCEIKAFKRLAARLKKQYPRLPICLLGDSLYACEPVFKICNDYKWKFLFRFKEGRIKTLWSEFQQLKKIEPNTAEECLWLNNVYYNERLLNVLETTIVDREKEKDFVFVTDMNITKRNACRIALSGRSRWKIENQGFNNQKNIRFNIEHICCFDYNAMKNHYLLVQIADILRQLFEKGSDFIKNLKCGIKEISSRLLESFRRDTLTNEDIIHLNKRTQIRYL